MTSRQTEPCRRTSTHKQPNSGDDHQQHCPSILNKELSQAFPQMKLKQPKTYKTYSHLRRIEAAGSHSRGASLNLLKASSFDEFDAGSR
ncbi:hypothetical protein ElyMa_006398400 [Elysia marginata]|uniref:Uncharacterized protein n=1 Tax=Elysia marginata TaxID=1093978 RepID=A0AAV4HSN3_9GAST|nr:hypothetical protein ElyMa_006398400 [Elysia marginata]